MATQKIIQEIEVTDKGSTSKVIKSAKELSSLLKEAGTSASNAAKNIKQALSANTPTTPGGTPGSRKVAEKAANPVFDYGKQRGAAGVTGASARDFANQAQGLGGLVRLYATYAANIFAVGAAFRALSTAMDTTNMVKGLDQLGAAGGRALGTLSKRLVDATDGAISLREAMEATAKASSSGMSSANILRMGEAAKKASQALGVDMGDAVSRLTRGITKLEPELLDELGIFVRVDDVVQNYAKSVGKTAAAVTDFERRQAFANAVIDQAEQKFGAIKIDSNPYTKLAAAMRDLMQTGLELANKVLTPIVSLLATSPTALAGVMAGIGITILKQAIPALGEFKAGLASAAEKATEISIQKAQDAANARSKLDSQILGNIEAMAEEKVAAVDRAEAKVLDLERNSVNKRSAAYKLLQKDVHDLSEEDFAAAEKKVKVAERAQARVMDLEKLGLDKRTAAYKLLQKNIREVTAEDIAGVEARAQAAAKAGKVDQAKTYEKVAAAVKAYKRVGEPEYYKEVISAVKEHKQAEEDLIKTKKRLQDENEKAARGFGVYGTILQNAMKAQANATKATIVTNAAYNGSLIGVRGAITLMREELKASEVALTRTEKITTLVKGGFAAVGGAISTMLTRLGHIGMLVGIAVGAFTALHSWMTKAAEQQAKFQKTSETLSGVLKTLSETIDNINSKAFGQQFSSESMLARATALAEVSATVKQLVKDYEALETVVSGSWWDRAINNIKRLWGGDIGAKMSKDISGSIMGSINALSAGPEGKELRNKIASILNIDTSFTESTLSSALKGREGDARILREIANAQDEVAKKTQIATEKLKDFDLVMQAGIDSYKKFADKFKVTNEFTELGEAIVGVAAKLPGIFDTPEAALTKLLEVSQDTKKLSLFGSEDQVKLIKFSKEMQSLTAEVGANQVALQKARKELSEYQSEVDAAGGDYSSLSSVTFEQIARRDAAAEKERAAAAKVAESNAKVSQTIAQFPTLTSSMFEKGANLIRVGMEAAAAKVGGALTDAAVSALGNLPGMAQIQADLQLKQIAADNALIKTQMELISAERELSAKISLQTAVLREANARAALQSLGAEDSGSLRTKYQDELSLAQAETKIANARVQVLNKIRSGSVDAVNAIAEAYKEGGESMQAEAASLLQYAQQMAGFKNQLSAAGDKAAAVQFSADVKEEQARLEAKLKDIDTRKTNTSTDIKDLAYKTRSGDLSEEARINEELRLKSKLISLDAERTEAEYTSKRLIAQKALTVLEKQGKGKNLDDAKKALAIEDENIKNARRKSSQDLKDLELDAAQKLTLERKRQLEVQQKIAAIVKGTEFDRIDTQNKLLTEQISLEETLGVLNKVALEEKRSALAQSQAALEFDRTSFNEQQAHLMRIAELNTAIAAAGAESTVGRDLQAEKDAETARYASALANEQALYTAKLQTLEATKQLNVENAKFSEWLEAIKGLDTVFEGLGKGLEGLGSKLADVVDNMRTYARDSERHAKRVQELETQASNPDIDIKERLNLNKQIKSAQDDQIKSEIAGIGKIAGASKKMFSEKTAAHKALSAVERVSAAMSFALQAKQMALELAALPGKIAGGVGTLFFQGGFAGFAGAAAFLALMASLGASTGGAKSGVGAADMQAVQGTGQAYINGRVEDTGKGVLGDSTAKNADIVNSIELLRDLNIDGININQKMLYALEQIENNTKILAAKAYGVQGLTGGRSAFGTVEKSNAGFLGLFASSTSIIDTGIKALAGATIDTIEQFIAQYETVQKTSSGFLGIGGGTKIRENTKALEAEFAKDVGALFKSGKDALAEAFSELGLASKDTVNELVGNFNVENFRASFKDLKGDELVTALNATIGEALSDAVRGLAPFLRDYRQLGEGMMGTAIRVGAELNHVTTALKFMGNNLKLLPNIALEASQATITANEQAKQKVIEATQAVAAAQAGLSYSFFEGEGMVASAESVDALNKAREALTVANIEAAKTAEMLNEEKYKNIQSNIEMTQLIIEATGGIDKFNESFSFYIDNFMTASERMAGKVPLVVQALRELDAEFPNMGIAALTTREQFSSLVQSLNLTTEAGASLYGKLMGIAQDFAAVTPALKDKGPVVYLGGITEDQAKNSAEDIAKQARKQEIEILKLQGKATEALALEREDELAAMDASLRATQQYIYALQDKEKLDKSLLAMEMQILSLTGQTEALKSLKRAEELKGLTELEILHKNYIYALEDEQQLKQDLVSAYDKEAGAIKTTVDRLKQATKTLKDFRDQLLLGDKSPLTPAEQYAEAKRQVAAVAETLSKVATTEEEKAAQAEAASKYTQVANAFLEASRNYYASGDMYQKDFTKVLDYSGGVTNILEAQQTDAEKQLDRLDSIKGSLSTINTSTKSVAELMAQLVASSDAASKAKNELEAYKSANPRVEPTRPVPTVPGTPTPTTGDIVKDGIRYAPGGAVYDAIKGILTGNNGVSMTGSAARELFIQHGLNTDGSINAASLSTLLKQSKSLGLSMTMLDEILQLASGSVNKYATERNIPSFDVGTNWVMNDTIAQVHEGERIMPKADNVELINAIANRRNNETVLVQEIRRLNQKVERLETVIANGAVLNAQATDRNTEAVVTAVESSANKTQFANKVSERAKIQ